MGKTHTSSPLSPVEGGPNPHLAHHFDTEQQQLESVKLGMWIFLATEVLLFSGLFCAYAVYRSNHPEVFRWAHVFLNVKLGALNTVVLITSSLSMAWALRAAQLGQQRLLKICLVLTLVGAMGFLGIKYVEYKNKWQEGLLWAGRYHPTAEAQQELLHEQASASAGLKAAGGDGVAQLSQPVPKQLWWFFGIYFLMTGLHGIHVLGGIGAISWLLVRSLKGQFGPRYYTPVDLVGLYWHLVDIIWIFLFPLLYLIR